VLDAVHSMREFALPPESLFDAIVEPPEVSSFRLGSASVPSPVGEPFSSKTYCVPATTLTANQSRSPAVSTLPVALPPAATPPVVDAPAA